MKYTVKDVKKACNGVLHEAFPDIPIYETDTLDGYKRPSFFVELNLKGGRGRESAYLTRFGYRYRITYFEVTHDEAHCLDVFQQIEKAFGTCVKVNKNKLVVESTDYQFIDEHADKLQVTVTFSDAVELGGYVEDGDYITTVTTRTIVKGGNA